MDPLAALAINSLRQTRNSFRILRRQSLFKCIFIGVFAVLLELGLFLLFLDGFRFLDRLGGIGVFIIGRLFSLFFLGMGTMLMVSGVVTAYMTILRAEEIRFLMARPVADWQIVLYKFAHAAHLSSWAFFVIVIPFAGAFAWHERMPLAFALWTLLFSFPYLALWAGLGAVIALLVVRWMPGGRAIRFAEGAVFALLGVGAVIGLRFVHGGHESPQFDVARLVPGLRLASNAYMPSSWLAEGIVALSRGQWAKGFMLWGLLTSSAAVVVLGIDELARRSFYETWLRVSAGSGNAKRRPFLLESTERRLRFLPSDVRAMLVKDVRVFLRDPLQWSQTLVFFGLLGLYFGNLRSFNYHALPAEWQTAIAVLNVFSLSAVMCSLGARFIYPQLSLEGQGFWILGLAPTSMRRILLTKFFGSALGMLAISVVLTTVSSHMLNIAPAARAATVFMAACVALAICGLSVGLGTVFLDLRERNPAVIVSGFGGTLNLVLCLAFVLAVILPMGAVMHLNAVGMLLPGRFVLYSWLSGTWVVGLTLAASILPLGLGVRSLQSRDF